MKFHIVHCINLILAILLSFDSRSQTNPLKVSSATNLNRQSDKYNNIALTIWNYAELGYKEQKSSGLLRQILGDAGFSVDSGGAGMPTSFVASYGSGHPVIGILAEFDALPGLSQTTGTGREAAAGRTTGHGCGHHLFGTASVAAAIQVKELIASGKLKGTIRVFGCPAEEGGAGKVYLVRDGAFKNVDAVLHWHPSDLNDVTIQPGLAVVSAKFRFHGLSAHASGAPDKGRSALDAVEAMDYMVNMMREHVPQETRIHYVITNGGKAPNVVPDFAEVYYYVRHPDREMCRSLFARVVKCADAGALGTDTKVDYEIIHGTYDLLINHTLNKVAQANLKAGTPLFYTAEEEAYARKIQSTFTYKYPPLDTVAKVALLNRAPDAQSGSTDVGDVSWAVPTVGIEVSTWVPGTQAHSWQAVSCGGTSIGMKGMMKAATTICWTAIDLFQSPKLLQGAKVEFDAAHAADFVYKALLGNRKPPLNYRD